MGRMFWMGMAVYALDVMGVMGVPPNHVTHRDHDEKQAADGQDAFFDLHGYNLARAVRSHHGADSDACPRVRSRRRLLPMSAAHEETAAKRAPLGGVRCSARSA